VDPDLGIGGMIGGIGMALMEHSVADGRNGRVPNANFAEYATGKRIRELPATPDKLI
jgi:CO/xanthine dehydrogenase Mo-binding subunit